MKISGDKVRLGVEAHKNVPVYRREVYDAIKRHEAIAAITPEDAHRAIVSATQYKEVSDQATQG